MIIALLITLILFLLPDGYIYSVYLRDVPVVWRILFFLPTVIGFSCIAGFKFSGINAPITTLFMVILLCFALPKLFFVAFSLFSKLLGIWSLKASSVVMVTGLVVAFAVAVCAMYGLTAGWKNLEVKRVDIGFENLPEAFDGYKIVHISDLHIGSYGKKTEFVQRVVDSVNALGADLVVFTGDLVNRDPDELPLFVPALSRMTAADGVFSVLGNHDYCLYGDPERWSDMREGAMIVADNERNMGWTLLMNESRIITRDTGRIAIAGVENTGKPPFPQIGDLKAALKDVTDCDSVKCEDDVFAILLTHDPSHWRMEVLPKTHVPLTLCGHTHAAQLKIGNWSPSRWMYDEWDGLYESGGQKLHISHGVGGTFPFRFGARPQITLLTLHRIS